VHAACLAELGFEVLGTDLDLARIESLSQGRAPFCEPGLDAMLGHGLRSGRLRFTTSLPEAAQFGDVHFLCVGTPQQEGHPAADLRLPLGPRRRATLGREAPSTHAPGAAPSGPDPLRLRLRPTGNRAERESTAT
jgi:UDP-glucose/GDP-mannose dehydrogenase family, NAD binding domain